MAEQALYFSELIEAVRDFCRLIEQVSSYDKAVWLGGVCRVLARIQMAMTHLDEVGDVSGETFVADLDARFALFCRLKKELGDYDAYWLEYDSTSEPGGLSGSLAGDFADIHFELMRGLKLLDGTAGSEQDVLRLWQGGYLLKWGQRLVDAQKHLFSLRVARLL